MECIFAHATKFSNAAAFALMMKIRKSYFRLSLHFKIIIQFTESILSCGMVGGWGVRERERVHCDQNRLEKRKWNESDCLTLGHWIFGIVFRWILFFHLNFRSTQSSETFNLIRKLFLSLRFYKFFDPKMWRKTNSSLREDERNEQKNKFENFLCVTRMVQCALGKVFFSLSHQRQQCHDIMNKRSKWNEMKKEIGSTSGKTWINKMGKKTRVENLWKFIKSPPTKSFSSSVFVLRIQSLSFSLAKFCNGQMSHSCINLQLFHQTTTN